MSIELENPKTPLEKADATGNFIHQMYLAHQTKDQIKFMEAYEKSAKYIADVIDYLDK